MTMIRTIYLYLFALVGLTLLIIGTVRFIDMGLRIFVFTKADEQEKVFNVRSPVPAETEEGQTEKEDFQQIDLVTSQRHRDAASNSSMIIVGLPLFLYHWRIIRRETKK